SVMPRISSRSGLLLEDAGKVSAEERLSFSLVETALRQVCITASGQSCDEDDELLVPWLRIGAARGLRMVFLDAGRPLLPRLERLYRLLVPNDPRMSDVRPYIATLLRSTVQSN